jgi:mercuric ion transport protein
MHGVLRVTLVYDRECPNVDRTRSMIRAALRETGAAVTWAEWDRGDAATPAELRSYGSPTVLVNGLDVGFDENETAQSDANACRVYADDCGCLSGVPSSQAIADAIRRTTGKAHAR